MTNSELTWQPGSNGRKGRWKKKYRGKTHYFPGGRGKSDREAKKAAQWAWEKLKRELDENAPKRFQPEYEQAIETWQSVLAWCRRHGDDDTAKLANEKIDHLTERLGMARPKPVQLEDTFEGQFDQRVYAPELAEFFNVNRQLERLLALGVNDKSEAVENEGGTTLTLTGYPGGQSPDTQRYIWEDRLQRSQVSRANLQCLSNAIQRFVEQKVQDAVAGQLSASRPDKLRSHLGHFANWSGTEISVADIDGAILNGYRQELLRLVDSGKWKPATVKDRMGSVRSFVRWLWHMDLIPAMPKIMDGASTALRIDTPDPEIVTYTLEEISTLLAAATGQTKLFVLLMLNIGCTQKDIADLHQDEVDWDDGRVIRRRSKTRKYKTIPTVNYKLWDETFSLLKKHRDSRSELVLVNRNGRPLVWDEVGEHGRRYKKSDSIKNRFDRLRSSVGLQKSLRHLKKTSASMIRGNPKYASLRSLFLGHASQSISDKHYVAPPQELLDEAIMWLGEQYGVVKKADD